MVTNSIASRKGWWALTASFNSLLRDVSERGRAVESTGDGHDIVAAFPRHADVAESSSMGSLKRPALAERISLLLECRAEGRAGEKLTRDNVGIGTCFLRHFLVSPFSSEHVHRDKLSISAICQFVLCSQQAVLLRRISLRVLA